MYHTNMPFQSALFTCALSSRVVAVVQGPGARGPARGGRGGRGEGGMPGMGQGPMSQGPMSGETPLCFVSAHLILCLLASLTRPVFDVPLL